MIERRPLVLRKLSEWLVALWPKYSEIHAIAGWRPCPHCGTAITKNGGCPMMRCAECELPFRWGRWLNTTKHVIVEHCPQANGGGARRRRAAAAAFAGIAH